MKSRIVQVVMFLLAAVFLVNGQETKPPATTQSAPPAAPKTFLKVGQPAPDFTLPDTTGKKVTLSDFKGKKNVVLAFYVLAFTGG
jgi:cytochrome oxidase Cu insertion factor (SCO1/SenC/PrrC family)